MKRTDWIILIIVILLIVAIGIWAYTSEEAKNTKGGRLQALNDRISKINKQIDDEMKSLKLTTEMKKFVDKRISQWLWVVNSWFNIFCILFQQ
jgi:cell division protein FtsL